VHQVVIYTEESIAIDTVNGLLTNIPELWLSECYI